MATGTSNASLHLRGLSGDAVIFTILWAAGFALGELGELVPASRVNDVMLIVNLYHIVSVNPIPAFLLLVLFSYLAADLYLDGRKQLRVKLAALFFSMVAFVIMPTLLAISYRNNTVPYLYVHDGAIQIEEAIKVLLAGKNPYTTSYASTPMAQWPFYEAGISINPSLDHLAYPPLTILLSLPFYVLTQLFGSWYDQRLVYLVVFVLGGLLLVLAAETITDKAAALSVFALNPLFAVFFVEGRNDIMVSFWLIVLILCLQHHRLGWASVAMAFAMASKQTAWLLLPFFVAYVFGTARAGAARVRALALLPGAVTLIVIFSPFMLWNSSAFIDGVINYASGLSSGGTLYPIKSLGLGGLLFGLQWIKEVNDTFPFTWFQIAFSGVATLFLLSGQLRMNTLTRMLVNYAVVLFIFSFFSRTFNDNHLGFSISWLILPSFIRDTPA